MAARCILQIYEQRKHAIGATQNAIEQINKLKQTDLIKDFTELDGIIFRLESTKEKLVEYIENLTNPLP